jgi:hypothetical protein
MNNESVVSFMELMRGKGFNVEMTETNESFNIVLNGSQTYHFLKNGKVVVDAFGRKGLNEYESWEEVVNLFNRKNEYNVFEWWLE